MSKFKSGPLGGGMMMPMFGGGRASGSGRTGDRTPMKDGPLGGGNPRPKVGGVRGETGSKGGRAGEPNLAKGKAGKKTSEIGSSRAGGPSKLKYEKSPIQTGPSDVEKKLRGKSF